MCSFESVGDLSCDRQRFVDGDGTVANPIRKRRPFDELEDERAIFESMYLRDVWMIECREQLGLTLKPCEPFRIVRECVRQHFDRDVTLKSRVFGAIHFSHPAGADERNDFI
jgi:hypothetical protein